MNYTLSVEDAERMFLDAGVPRSKRSIMRYCNKIDRDGTPLLDCDIQSNEIEEGRVVRRFMITPESVQKRIEEVKKIQSPIYAANDISRHVATPDDKKEDLARHVATPSNIVEKTIDLLHEQMKTKDEQIKSKDRQIDNLLERNREANILIKGLSEQIYRLEAPNDMTRHDATDDATRRATTQADDHEQELVEPERGE